MSNIIEVQGAPLEPELAVALRPILAKWEAAIVRVAAAEKRPNLMTFAPAAGSREAILQRRFKSLPKEARARSSDRANIIIDSRAFKERLGRYLDLGSLTGAKTVDAVARALPLETRINDKQLNDLMYERFGVSGPPSTKAPAFKSLRLDLFRIVCIDETNGFLGSEWGDDEIELSGVTIDETADIKKLPALGCGNFNDGTRRDFVPTRRLFTFNLTEGVSFPKSYFVTFYLVEADMGNLSETVNGIVERLKSEASDALTKLISGATGVPPALIGASVKWLVNKVVNKVVAIWEDDPFRPETVELRLPDASSTFAVGFDGSPTRLSRVVNFKGPGDYAMRYHWTLSTAAGGS